MDLLEVVEAMTKNLYSEGRITHEQLNAIFKKYGKNNWNWISKF